jgi:hypothetical protein
MYNDITYSMCHSYEVRLLMTLTIIITYSSDTRTAVSHVIVNTAYNTRTCIHTPLTQEISAAELNVHLSKISTFEQYGWVHFDSRHTEASLQIAKAAKSAGCFLSIDAERDRPPYLRELISICDILFISKDFAENMFPNWYSNTVLTCSIIIF